MRYAKKVDANQPEIIAALRAAGWEVHVTSAVGAGIPDLAATKHGLRIWVECKVRGEQLTEAERVALATWLPGHYVLAFSGQDAVDKCAAIYSQNLPAADWRTVDDV